MYQHVLFEREEGIATITLNRPDKLNAYIPELGDEIVDAFRKVRDDAASRVVILTGAGRAFCAGVDLEYLKSAAPKARRPLGEEDFIRKLPLELASFPKPVIAAVNGAAIGAGVTMILPCDIRLAAAGAKMAVPFTKLGILPGLGSTHLLPRIVGMGRALELVMTARTFLAEEAAELGLVHKVLAPEDLMAEARALAATIAANDPASLAVAKRALHYGATATLEEAMENERASNLELRKLREAGELMAQATAVPAIEGWFTLDPEAPALIGTRCASCGSVFFPRQALHCRNPACEGGDLEPVELSRRGRLWSYTDNRYAPPPPYVAGDPFEPYAVAAVELLAEGIVVLGQVVPGVAIEALEVGMEMELVIDPLYRDDANEYLVWKWRPVTGAAR